MRADDLDRLLQRADEFREQGRHGSGMEILRRVLSTNPDHAYAHAALAHSLLMLRRAPAARIEAQLALDLDPEEPMGHFSMAAVCVATRDFATGRHHIDLLEVLEPDRVSTHMVAAALALEERDTDRALASMQRATPLAPYDPEVLAMLGDVHLARDELEDADRCCAEALQADPGSIDARLLKGQLELRAGHPDRARAHARWALGHDPDRGEGIALLAAAKAAQSRLGGLWWRVGAWLNTLDERRMMATLLGVFITVQVIAIVAEENGFAFIATLVRRTWLALCVYTWVGPALFRRTLQRELDNAGSETTAQ